MKQIWSRMGQTATLEPKKPQIHRKSETAIFQRVQNQHLATFCRRSGKRVTGKTGSQVRILFSPQEQVQSSEAKPRGFVVLSTTPYFYDLRTKLVNSSFFSRKGCTFAAANLTKLIPNEKKNCFHGCDSHSRHDHLGWRIDD